MLQSNDEILRVADEWVRNFCPPNLVKDGEWGAKNAELIMERCLHTGIVSISGLTQAERELRAEGKLALVPTLTPAQKQAALNKKLQDIQHQKDIAKKQENSPAAVAARVEAAGKEQKAKEDAKELANIKSQIAREINNYIVGHQSGAMNYSATESGRESLQAVLSKHNTATIAGAKRALEAVRIAKGKLS